MTFVFTVVLMVFPRYFKKIPFFRYFALCDKQLLVE